MRFQRNRRENKRRTQDVEDYQREERWRKEKG